MTLDRSQLRWGTLFLGAILALFFISRENYLLFHILVEFAVICTGVTIFVIAVNTRRFSDNDFLFFIGIVYFFVSLIDFFHTVTYRGMAIFPGLSSDVPTQLWIAERYLLAISMLIAPFFIKKKFPSRNLPLVYLSYSLVAFGILLSIFYLKVFPAAFVDGVGLTPFKIISEFIISLLFVLGLILLYRKKGGVESSVFWYIFGSIVFSVLAEISFTQYASTYGISNMIGHLFLLASYFQIYKALIQISLNKPVETLFRDLQFANQKLSILSATDPLTGLYNRRKALEKISDQFWIAKRFGNNFSLIMTDIDNFKEINDKYGHITGDKVLAEVASALKESFREIDIVGRYGGDEFIICAIEANGHISTAIMENTMERINDMAIISEKGEEIKLTLSVGVCELQDQEELAEIIESADENLLRSKKEGKNRLVATIKD